MILEEFEAISSLNLNANSIVFIVPICVVEILKLSVEELNSRDLSVVTVQPLFVIVILF